ncbi:unnamed protein product [Arabidopsis halleri]
MVSEDNHLSFSLFFWAASLERIMDILALVWYHSRLNEDRKRLGWYSEFH